MFITRRSPQRPTASPPTEDPLPGGAPTGRGSEPLAQRPPIALDGRQLGTADAGGFELRSTNK